MSLARRWPYLATLVRERIRGGLLSLPLVLGFAAIAGALVLRTSGELFAWLGGLLLGMTVPFMIGSAAAREIEGGRLAAIVDSRISTREVITALLVAPVLPEWIVLLALLGVAMTQSVLAGSAGTAVFLIVSTAAFSLFMLLARLRDSAAERVVVIFGAFASTAYAIALKFSAVDGAAPILVTSVVIVLVWGAVSEAIAHEASPRPADVARALLLPVCAVLLVRGGVGPLSARFFATASTLALATSAFSPRVLMPDGARRGAWVRWLSVASMIAALAGIAIVGGVLDLVATPVLAAAAAARLLALLACAELLARRARAWALPGLLAIYVAFPVCVFIPSRWEKPPHGWGFVARVLSTEVDWHSHGSNALAPSLLAIGLGVLVLGACRFLSTRESRPRAEEGAVPRWIGLDAARSWRGRPLSVLASISPLLETLSRDGLRRRAAPFFVAVFLGGLMFVYELPGIVVGNWPNFALAQSALLLATIMAVSTALRRDRESGMLLSYTASGLGPWQLAIGYLFGPGLPYLGIATLLGSASIVAGSLRGAPIMAVRAEVFLAFLGIFVVGIVAVYQTRPLGSSHRLLPLATFGLLVVAFLHVSVGVGSPFTDDTPVRPFLDDGAYGLAGGFVEELFGPQPAWSQLAVLASFTLLMGAGIMALVARRLRSLGGGPLSPSTLLIAPIGASLVPWLIATRHGTIRFACVLCTGFGAAVAATYVASRRRVGATVDERALDAVILRRAAPALVVTLLLAAIALPSWWRFPGWTVACAAAELPVLLARFFFYASLFRAVGAAAPAWKLLIAVGTYALLELAFTFASGSFPVGMPPDLESALVGAWRGDLALRALAGTPSQVSLAGAIATFGSIRMDERLLLLASTTIPPTSLSLLLTALVRWRARRLFDPPEPALRVLARFCAALVFGMAAFAAWRSERGGELLRESLESGHPVAVSQSATRVIEADPEELRGYVARLSTNIQPKRDVDDARRVLRSRPDYVFVLRHRGEARWRARRLRLAQRDLEALQRERPDDVRGWELLEHVRLEMGDVDGYLRTADLLNRVPVRRRAS